MKYFILVFVIAFLVAGCSYVNQYLGLEDDNLGEEILEEVIESQIGVDVDLTPGSKE